MDEDEHTKETYAHFGLAVYLAQVLEHGLVNALVILKLPERNRLTRTDIDAFMDKRFENTLGRLISDLRQVTSVPEELDTFLSRALRKRNWLCHHYFRVRAVELMTAAGRDAMIAELKEAQELFMQADTLLSETVQPLAARYGITKKACEAECQRLLEEHGITA